MREYFRAPWSNSLRLTTLIFLTLILVVMVLGGVVGAVIGGVIILFSLMLMVRGYSIQNGLLVVHGLIWNRSYPLHSLCDLEYNPNITSGSIRTFGIGGLFSYLGYFNNKLIGNYLSFVTDNSREVVLYFDGSVIVISPEDPLSFVEAIRLEYRRIRVN